MAAFVAFVFTFHDWVCVYLICLHKLQPSHSFFFLCVFSRWKEFCECLRTANCHIFALSRPLVSENVCVCVWVMRQECAECPDCHWRRFISLLLLLVPLCGHSDLPFICYHCTDSAAWGGSWQTNTCCTSKPGFWQQIEATQAARPKLSRDANQIIETHRQLWVFVFWSCHLLFLIQTKVIFWGVWTLR